MVLNAVTHALQVLMIALAELMPDPSQPRKTFPDDEIQRLAASIAARGVLQPLRVIWDEQRQVWLILTGESRYRAAKLAGLETVPCIPVAGELSEADRLADRLTENNVRHDLEPMEEARGLAQLKALKGCNVQGPGRGIRLFGRVDQQGRILAVAAAGYSGADRLRSRPDRPGDRIRNLPPAG